SGLVRRSCAIRACLSRFAKCQQVNDVGRWQGWVRTVLGVQLLVRSLESHADVVLLNCGGQGQVDYRFGLGWIDELNRPANEKVPTAVEDDISPSQDGPAEDHGFRDGAAYLEIRGPANTQRSADQ